MMAASDKLSTAVLAVALLASTASWSRASAASGDLGRALLGGFIGAMAQAAAIDNARRSWGAVDQRVQQCLVNQYRISPAQLVQKGIPANDQRVYSYLNSCQLSVAQAAAQAEAAAEAQHAQAIAAESAREAQAAAAEQERRAEAAAAEQTRKAEAAAAAQAVAEEEARRKQLVSRFGVPTADVILAGNVQKGMTKEAVIASRGNPLSIERIPPADELWRYGTDRIVFTKGKVTYIGH